MAKNPPDGSQRAHAYLAYEDAPAALEFLCKAFGFEETYRLTMDDGRIGHADLSYGGVVIASLASLWREMGFESPKDLAGIHSQIFVYVDDVEVPRSTTDGWEFDSADQTSVTFSGSWCDAISADEVDEIRFVYGCPLATIY